MSGVCVPCTWALVFVCTCMCVYVETWGQAWCLPQPFSTLIFRQGLFLNLEVTDPTRLMNPLGSTCLCFPSTGITGVHHGWLYMVTGNNIQVLFLTQQELYPLNHFLSPEFKSLHITIIFCAVRGNLPNTHRYRQRYRQTQIYTQTQRHRHRQTHRHTQT